MTHSSTSFQPSLYSVLVVDDDAPLRRAILWDLNRKGYQTFEAENGEVAYQIVEKNSVQLVLTDIRMPVCDGIQLLERLKRRNPQPPVVMFLSGFSDLTPEEACDLGAESVLSKPFQRKVLFQSIEEAIQKRKEVWLKKSQQNEFSTAPDHTLQGSYRFQRGTALAQEPYIAMGRGGFFVSLPSIPVHWTAQLTELSFDIQLREGPVPHLRGQGKLIWTRKPNDSQDLPSGAGLEILTLEDSLMEPLLRWIDESKPRAWIPRG